MPGGSRAHPSSCQWENSPLWVLLLQGTEGCKGTLLLGSCPRKSRAHAGSSSWGGATSVHAAAGKCSPLRPLGSRSRSQNYPRCGLYVLLTPYGNGERVRATDWVLFQLRERLPEILKTPAET